jgi:hypothetical protein
VAHASKWQLFCVVPNPAGRRNRNCSLNDGKLTGGDTVLAYSGTYFQNGDRFSASVRTQRHSPGQASIFGIDKLDLTLTGKSTPTTASWYPPAVGRLVE